MKSKIFALGLLAASLLVSSTLLAADAGATKKILFFSKSAGFEHSSIRRGTNGELSHAEKVLQELGAKNNFAFTFIKDGSLFTPENLAGFDAFFFYTTGDLTTTGTDHNPPMSKAGKAAFLEAIKNGKGFVATHSASDTFHSPNYNDGTIDGKYKNDGDKADPYIKMLGGEFIIHGAQQKSHLIVADPKFPGVSAVPADFGPNEEWYSLKNFAPNLHVVLVQDTTGMKGNIYDRPAYPSTWARMYGQGRVFYTNMGHREDVWDNPVFQSVLIGGLNWAVHNVDADVTPNIEQAAPKAGETQNHPAP
jgi:type 1 glutamine amidotransferase